MYLVGVQTPVTHQFSGEKQHGNLVAVAHLGRGICIDVEYVHPAGHGFLQGREFHQHVLAQSAAGSRVQHEARRRPVHVQ